jgi:acetyl-CoA synthetase
MTSQSVIFSTNQAWAERAQADAAVYDEMYAYACENPDDFWRSQGRRLSWMKSYTKVKNVSFDRDDFRIRWFEDGMLNAAYNCIDRHLSEKADQAAIVWEGDDPTETRSITYRELHEEVCRFANVLKRHGVGRGSTVTIYLPMIPEAAFAMLACARIGAIHTVVFGGFSPESLANRIEDCGSKVVITANEGVRGGKTVPLKKNVDAAIAGLVGVETVLVVNRTEAEVEMLAGRDLDYRAEAARVEPHCSCEPMGAEDPLFILYTSGSTGKPKGLLHTTGGYLVYASITHRYLWDYREGEIFWCAADVGWITGHTYVVYGPLANGATTLMYEGVPNYPDASRLWEIVDKHQVSTFITAPTAIRALMREGTGPVEKTSRASLRLLSTVGEPINPEAWRWFYDIVGEGRCPIIDMWWQTETGGAMIAPLPGSAMLKPGSATKPFFGVKPALVNDRGEVLEGAASGNLVLIDSWPGQARTIYKDHARYFDTYFSTYPGMYFTGDGSRRDEDGDYWITGRVDDVINVSGHRLGTAELEAALASHPKVTEAAVVGVAHDLKGQGIYAFVTLHIDAANGDATRSELIGWVRSKIGPIASLDALQFAPALPKTRSGKIMRRILRKIAENDVHNVGDTTTLADPGVVSDLIANRVHDLRQ